MNNKSERPISVIIRSKNEERWIGHSIQSVIDTFDNVEIIIIDNGSKDDTLFIVKNFIEDPSFKNKNGSYADIKIFNMSLIFNFINLINVFMIIYFELNYLLIISFLLASAKLYLFNNIIKINPDGS